MKDPIQVCIVDDNIDDIFFFKEAIKHNGSDCTISVFNSCADVADHLKKTAMPDIIFFDLNLDGIKSWDCIKTIRDNSQYDNIYIVVYSGSNDKTDIDLAWKVGADRYIHKAENIVNLRMILSFVLKSHHFISLSVRNKDNFFVNEKLVENIY